MSINGYNLTVTLSASGQPRGVSIVFIPPSGTQTFFSIMKIRASADAPQGTYTITITGTGADGKVRTTTYSLEVIEFPVGPTSFKLVEGSTLEIIMSTHPVDNEVVPPPVSRDLESIASFVVVAETPVDGISNLTIPAESFSAKPLYLATKEVIKDFPIRVWITMSMPMDGYGYLALWDKVLEVDVSTEVIGHGDNTYHVESIIENTGPAGSVLAIIMFHIKSWAGDSETEIGKDPSPLMEMYMPMIVTTGRSRTKIVDPGYPAKSVSLDCYSMEAQGVPMDLTRRVTMVSTGGLLDVYSKVLGVKTWTDVLFKTIMVQVPEL